MLSLLAVVLIPALLVTHTAGSAGADASVKTWWHATAHQDWMHPVAADQVRQSHMYEISVSGDGERFFDSFVYESIPRNGHDKQVYPNDPSSISGDDDGVSIEAELNMTMAWSSFLYNKDVQMRVRRLNGATTKPSNVIIRPTTLNYKVEPHGDQVVITVPYSAVGTRFSVEFHDNAYTYRTNWFNSSASYIQNQVPGGTGYYESNGDSHPTVGVEPHDALLIFASPFENPADIPSQDDPNTLVVEPGQITGLEQTTASAVYFPPGVYYSGSTAHANLSSSVSWVYLAPGAFVKSAFEFNHDGPLIRATGHGVLSGEQYLYQANTAQGYANEKSNDDSLRMWSGHIAADVQHQRFVLNGPTVSSPPFNSMDFKGNVKAMVVDAQDYKQVGAFYSQTDGLENYPGSHIRHVFYHSNDDTIKLYYSNVLVEDVVVWKGHVAPVIQFGWDSRTTSNITVRNLDIIHSRYTNNNSHSALIGCNQVYNVQDSDTSTGDSTNMVSSMTFTNIRSEGISPSLVRAIPLSRWNGIEISNVWIESFLPNTTGMSTSYIPSWTNSAGQQMEIANFLMRDVTTGAGGGNQGLFTGRSGQTAGNMANIYVPADYLATGNITII